MLPPRTEMQPPAYDALPLVKPSPVKVTSEAPSISIIPPKLLLKLRDELSTAPVLLLIFTLVFPEIVITPVNVMSLTTSIWALVLIALERAEKVETSYWVAVGTGDGTELDGCRVAVGTGDAVG